MSVIKFIRECPLTFLGTLAVGIILGYYILAPLTNKPNPQGLPTGLGNLNFGMVLKDVPEMKFLKKFHDNTEVYIRLPGIKKYEGVEVQSTFYFVRDEKFYAACIKFNSFESFRELEKILTEKYGRKSEEHSREHQHVWLAKNVLTLNFDLITSTCYIWIFDGKIFGKGKTPPKLQMKDKERQFNIFLTT